MDYAKVSINGSETDGETSLKAGAHGLLLKSVHTGTIQAQIAEAPTDQVLGLGENDYVELGRLEHDEILLTSWNALPGMTCVVRIRPGRTAGWGVFSADASKSEQLIYLTCPSTEISAGN